MISTGNVDYSISASSGIEASHAASEPRKTETTEIGSIMVVNDVTKDLSFFSFLAVF
jgi:hypothetical protein